MAWTRTVVSRPSRTSSRPFIATVAEEVGYLVGRLGGGEPYVVTIAPLNGAGKSSGSQIVMVLIADPDWRAQQEPGPHAGQRRPRYRH